MSPERADQPPERKKGFLSAQELWYWMMSLDINEVELELEGERRVEVTAFYGEWGDLPGLNEDHWKAMAEEEGLPEFHYFFLISEEGREDSFEGRYSDEATTIFLRRIEKQIGWGFAIGGVIPDDIQQALEEFLRRKSEEEELNSPEGEMVLDLDFPEPFDLEANPFD